MIAGSLLVLTADIPDAVCIQDVNFSGITTDTRNIKPGQLFVAIRGEQFDGHQFLQQAIDHGAAAVVAEVLPEGWNAPALKVTDTKVALGMIARFWRRKFMLPVIGVTGSNGKTTVKEMIASVLASHFGQNKRLATSGNLNNEIGVPLTVMQLNSSHESAVIEMGMNHPGEIAQLVVAAEPTIGLVNNAQREHQEFMHTVEAVARENGAVINSLPSSGVAVFPADDIFTSIWREFAGQRKVISFGFSQDADVTANYEADQAGNTIHLTAFGERVSFKLNASGVHNVRNAMAAAACCLAAGLTLKQIADGLTSFSPVKGRLQVHLSESHVTVIDDTYNANPDSVRAAIDVLRIYTDSLLILGDMGEVGEKGDEFHFEIGQYAREAGIEQVFLLGNLVKHTADGFGSNARFFSSLDELNEALDATVRSGMAVLVKGSRFMKMERVVQYLLKA